MIILLSMTLIFTGMWFLHLLSSKKIEISKQTAWCFLTYSPKFSRSLACIHFLVAAALLIQKFGISIGLVSWWLFASPISFFLILLINDLKKKGKTNKHTI